MMVNVGMVALGRHGAARPPRVVFLVELQGSRPRYSLVVLRRVWRLRP